MYLNKAFVKPKSTVHCAEKLLARMGKPDTSAAGAKAAWDKATTNLLKPKAATVSASDKRSPAQRLLARMHASAEAKPARSAAARLIQAATAKGARLITIRAVADEKVYR